LTITNQNETRTGEMMVITSTRIKSIGTHPSTPGRDPILAWLVLTEGCNVEICSGA
jgi:hypothetical protein